MHRSKCAFIFREIRSQNGITYDIRYSSQRKSDHTSLLRTLVITEAKCRWGCVLLRDLDIYLGQVRMGKLLTILYIVLNCMAVWIYELLLYLHTVK